MASKEASAALNAATGSNRLKPGGHPVRSQKAFCKAHDLNYHRFGYWRRKFREHDGDEQDQAKQSSGFVPVTITVHSRRQPDLSLVLPSGLVLQGHSRRQPASWFISC